MNIINIISRSYSLLHSYPGVPYWLLTPVRKIVRWFASNMLPKYLSHANNTHCKKKCELIVSFTSFPARINDVWQVVECMLRQSYRPSKIILWLSKEQFPKEKDIPFSLRSRENDIFEIRLVDGDIRSHKKYYYVSKEYPDSQVFLIDDDIYYPTDIIEKTWKVHLKFPNKVICNYGFIMRYDSGGHLLPYRKWQRMYKMTTDNIFFGSGGGTLICPSKLYKDFPNIKLAMDVTPIADDIWLNAMANLAGLKKVLLPNGQILPICIKDNVKLSAENRDCDQNDAQLNAIINYYMQQINVNPFDQRENYI